MTDEDLQRALGYVMRAPSLLETALTHSSYGHEHGAPDNERLEFLGDAVLQLITTEHLYERYAEVEEGHLSRARSHLVRRETLAEWARGLNLGECLRLGAGPQSSSIRTQERALANVFEAVLGAVYLDGGLAAAEGVVRPLIERHMLSAGEDLERFAKNPVSELQEWAQEHGHPLPTYEAHERRSGALGAQEWEVVVTVAGLPQQAGQGGTKALARRRAAARMMDQARASTDPRGGA